MSTTVSYKGAVLTTATNQTRTLTTAGKYMEDDVTITDVTVATNLQTKSRTYTPSTVQQTDQITADVGYDALQEVDITIDPVPTGSYGAGAITRNKSGGNLYTQQTYPSFSAGYFSSAPTAISAQALETRTVTPSESSQTVTPTGYAYYLESVLIDPIPSNYVGSSVPRKDSTDLYPNSSYQVVAPAGYYENNAVIQLPYEPHSAPGISLNPSTGLVTATHIQNVDYIITGSGTTSNTHQLSTQAGTTITPTTSQQTAVSVGKYTLGAVLVDPIPPQYIIPSGTININSNGAGIDVSQYASANVSVSAPTPTLQTKSETYTPTTSQITDQITADVGYDGLQEVDITINAVPTGSATTPTTTITANPSISVNPSTGLITATASASQSISPTVSAGYVSSGTAGTVSVSGSNTQQLSTQAATTITPTTSQQTAVAAGKYTTGAVLVDPIPPQYIVPSGTLQILSNGIANVSQYEYVDVDVGCSGGCEITQDQDGYLVISPTGGGSPTLITKNITANGTYNASSDSADGYSSVTVNVPGGGSLVVGVVRPDATLVQRWTYDRLFVTDNGGTIGAYSTTAAALLTSSNLSPTITMEDDYAYITLMRSMINPVYNNANAVGGKCLYGYTALAFEVDVVPAGETTYGGATSTRNVLSKGSDSSTRIVYCTSASQIQESSISSSSSMGGTYTYISSVPSVSSFPSLVVKNPAFYLKGSATYLNSTVWDTMTDIRMQYVVEVYKAPRSALNGWQIGSQSKLIRSCFNSISGTLT